MKRSLLVAAIACLELASLGQAFVNSAAFKGAAAIQGTPVATAAWVETYYPTNIPGYTCLAWYVVHGNFNSVSGSATLTNLSATAGLDLTNLASGTTLQPKLLSAALNGRDVLSFTNFGDARYLRTLNTTAMASVQPYEFVCVLKQTVMENNEMVILGGATHSIESLAVSERYGEFCSSWRYTASNSRITNTWFVMDAMFKNDTGVFLTNNVSAAPSGEAWTGPLSGLTLGCLPSGGYGWCGEVAELIVYSTELTATVRNNLYTYLKGKYGL